MTTDAIKHLGTEFHRAADSLADTLARLDNARLERLTFLRRCSKDSTARLAAIKEELRTLPEQIAKWDAEAARLESQTAEDLLRQALGAVVLHPQLPGEVIEAPLTQPAPEPYRAGLPPERLRTAWAQWEEKDSGLVDFRGNEYRGTMGDGTRDQRWRPMAELGGFADRNLWAFRPHGATWARVEAMADEAERAACDHTGHCERGTSCDCKCHKPGLVYANDPKPTPAAPTLLDLTKLPPGTVCEATGQIARGSHVILPGERFAFAGSSTEFLARVRVIERDESFDVPTMVHARVVKEGGEQ